MKFINSKTELTKQVGVDKDNNPIIEKLGYVDLALVGLNSPPKNGWSVGDMRVRFKVIDKLEGTPLGESVELNENEIKSIKDSSDIKWTTMHKDIVSYYDYLETLE